MLQYGHAYLTFAEIVLSDCTDRGITVTEIRAMDQPIDVSPETTAAFVGRALRGPLDTPVPIRHFGEFRRRFGDVWPRSSLGPAVRQFFEHGGRQLYVVRVANNARGALICLPASGSALVLRAVEPGSTERLRAAVDNDGIGDEDGFNLTLQRLDPATGLIVDQEIFRRVSHLADSDRFVVDVLLTSAIARVEQPYPRHRPQPTVNGDSRFDLEWVGHAQDGSDGTELSDYDLVGSRERGTGVFALEMTEHFDLMYLPPPGKGRDTGPAALLAAELYCRQRGAMLIVDPPSDAVNAADAVAAIRQRGYASPNMLGYFPRLVARGDAERLPRAAGGAIAGLLCKLDRGAGPWHSPDRDGLGFMRGLDPCVRVGDGEAQTLKRAGVNVIAPGPAGRARLTGGVTLGRGSASQRIFTSLPVRRLCLRVVNTIDLATRWVVFEQPDRELTERIRSQVLAYFACLHDLGALASDRFVVQCDAGLSRRADRLEHGVTILVVFHPQGSPGPVSFTLHQTVLGCRVATTAFAPVAEHCA